MCQHLMSPLTRRIKVFLGSTPTTELSEGWRSTWNSAPFGGVYEVLPFGLEKPPVSCRLARNSSVDVVQYVECGRGQRGQSSDVPIGHHRRRFPEPAVLAPDP